MRVLLQSHSELFSSFLLGVRLASMLSCLLYWRAGADLREECPVKDAVLDKTSGMWTVSVEDDTTFRARVSYSLASLSWLLVSKS